MPWSKGQSGNPGGRPKRKPLTFELARQLRQTSEDSPFTNAQAIAAEMIRLARGGDVPAARLIWEYVEGKPTQRVEFDLDAVAAQLAAEHGVDTGRLLRLTREIAARAG